LGWEAAQISLWHRAVNYSHLPPLSQQFPPASPNTFIFEVKESEIQKSILLEYVTLRRVFHRRNNSGAMTGEYKGKKWFMRFGAVGSPDISP